MPKSKQTRVPVTDTLKRREVLEEFLFWYFDSFVLPLLKVWLFLLRLGVAKLESQTTFYITDSSAYRNKVLYFRHDDWETLCAPLIKKLTCETFEKIPQVCL